MRFRIPRSWGITSCGFSCRASTVRTRGNWIRSLGARNRGLVIIKRMENDQNQLHWVETAGGPQLVLPEACAADWEGGATPSGGRIIQASFGCNPDAPATDYDRACS